MFKKKKRSECCVSHAPEGRKETRNKDGGWRRQTRQTDIYIYVCVYIHCQVCVTVNNPGAAGVRELRPQYKTLSFELFL